MAQRFLSLCRRYVVLGATFACLAGINIASDATAEHYLDPRWSVAAGGQLFDNWFNTLMVDAPRAAHPLYPRGGGLYGRDTWRCVSCHGWGTASGTDTTTLGLSKLRGKPIDKIQAAILSPSHGFTPDMLPPLAVERLARFIAFGATDLAKKINPASRQVSGDGTRGGYLYTNICSQCHGIGADAFPLADGPSLGAIARRDPWRVIHKIRFGEPDTGMVGLMLAPTDDIVDIVAFIQGFP